MLSYCVNLKAVRHESTSLNRIVADRSQCVIAAKVKLQLHDAIYRLRFYSNSLIHILSLSDSHNNVASIQKNRDDKSHPVTVAVEHKLQTGRVTRCSLPTTSLVKQL